MRCECNYRFSCKLIPRRLADSLVKKLEELESIEYTYRGNGYEMMSANALNPVLITCSLLHENRTRRTFATFAAGNNDRRCLKVSLITLTQLSLITLINAHAAGVR